MKWIGQHIYDLVSRFRSDVYLENVSTGTIASGAHLGLDSNNKIVKAVDGGGDLTSIVAGTGLSGTSLTGPIPTLNVDASQPGITTLAGVSAIGTAGTPIVITSDAVTFSSASADDPIVTIKNTSNAQNDMASLKFVKDRGATPGVGDNLAEIYFIGEDADQNSQEYGRILCETDVVTGGQESGVIKIGVANHDGGNGYGLIMQGGSVNDEIDVTVGLGAASVTTVAGTLTMGSTAAMTNAGLVAVANQSNITGLGTISSGVWQGTAIAHAYIGDDAIETVNIADAQVTVAKLHADAIQTSGESFADNDTSLMTSAAIDDKINTKYAYSYMTWSASAKPTRDGSNNPEWMLPNVNKGIYEEDWNADSGITSTTTGTTTYGFSRYHAANSLIIPHAGVLVGFHAIGRNDDSDLTFKAGLFHADNGLGGAGADGSAGEGIDYGNTTATNEYTLRCVATAAEAEASGGTDGTTAHNFKGPCKLISNTADLAVQAGDALMPAIMGNSSNSTDEIFVTMTIILKIPLTT